MDASYSYMLDIVDDLCESFKDVPIVCEICRKKCAENEYDIHFNKDEGIEYPVCSTCEFFIT
jgi:hypothetical protein